MFYLLKQREPVQVEWGDRLLIVPKYLMDDAVAWADVITQFIVDQVTSGMDDSQRRQYLTFYPVMPPDLAEMKRMIRTAQGAEHVVKTCLTRAAVITLAGKQSLPALTEDEIADLVAHNGPARLAGLAWALSDFEDDVRVKPPPAPIGEGGVPDPLRSSGTTESDGSPATTPSSTPSGDTSTPPFAQVAAPSASSRPSTDPSKPSPRPPKVKTPTMTAGVPTASE